MAECRWIGRNRQGVVATVQLLARAAPAGQATLHQLPAALLWLESPIPVTGLNLVVAAPAACPREWMAAMARRTQRRRVPCGWLLWPDDQPQRAFSASLRATGFQRAQRLTLCGRALPLHPSPVKSSAQVLGPAQRPAWQAWAQAVHGVPHAQAELVAHALLSPASPEVCSVGVLDPSGAVLAAASAVRCGAQGCTLLWVGTRAHWRNQGLGRQCLQAVLAWARQQGCQWAVVQSEASASSFYQRLGWHSWGHCELWIQPALSAPAP